MFEFINLMVKLIDPEVDNFKILDPLVKQCAVTSDDKIEVIYFKIHPPSLLKILKQLTQNYEIVIFTILPRRIMKAVYEAIPMLESNINFTLCQEETKIQNEFLIKDISLLLGNRELEDIYVVDCDEKAFDPDSV